MKVLLLCRLLDSGQPSEKCDIENRKKEKKLQKNKMRRNGSQGQNGRKNNVVTYFLIIKFKV
jgi:hypothetical protein